jgi:hypothetical protein
VIYHLHGYLPYEAGKKKEIVLSKTSYENFYRPGEFAYDSLTWALEHYNMIFVGFSFQDEKVCELLAGTSNNRQRFAFMPRGKTTVAKNLGLQPVVFDRYADIPGMLETIYCSALKQDELSKFGFSDPCQYWERLKKGPNAR